MTGRLAMVEIATQDFLKAGRAGRHRVRIGLRVPIRIEHRPRHDGPAAQPQPLARRCARRERWREGGVIVTSMAVPVDPGNRSAGGSFATRLSVAPLAQHDALRDQLGDFRLGVAVRGEHLRAVFAEAGGGGAGATRRARQLDRRAEAAETSPTSVTISRCRVCGAVVDWSTGSTGPAGTPPRISRSASSLPSWAGERGGSCSLSASRLWLRSALLAKRGSAAMSGRPMISHSFRNCPLLPDAMKMSQVCVGNLS